MRYTKTSDISFKSHIYNPLIDVWLIANDTYIPKLHAYFDTRRNAYIHYKVSSIFCLNSNTTTSQYIFTCINVCIIKSADGETA